MLTEKFLISIENMEGIIKFFINQKYFRLNHVKDILGIEKSEVKEFLNFLNKYNLIENKGGNGFKKTYIFNTILKNMINSILNEEVDNEKESTDG